MAGADEVDLPQLESDSAPGASPALLNGEGPSDGEDRKSVV